MYESFYGLTGKPFQLNPDPSFYFGSRQHRRAMAYLEYGVHQHEGFIVITGEIGAGKTTLVRSLFDKLDSSTVVAASLVSTQLEADELLRMVAAAFGISAQGDKSQLLLAIEAHLTSVASSGRHCLLVVDEAQNLSPRAVEELRMLSNFQLRETALLQSFLIGQPEFRAILYSPQMQQLRQRVIAACHIGPMDAVETRGYVEHRLKRVGWEGNPSFEPDAYQAIFEASGGIPRRINAVCDRLLLCGLLAEKRHFGRNDVAEVAEEFESETQLARQPAPDLWPAPASPGGLSEAELLVQQLSPEVVEEAGRIVADLSRDDLTARLVNLESSMLRLERNMLRLQGNNAATVMLLRRLLERLRAGSGAGDDASK